MKLEFIWVFLHPVFSFSVSAQHIILGMKTNTSLIFFKKMLHQNLICLVILIAFGDRIYQALHTLHLTLPWFSVPPWLASLLQEYTTSFPCLIECLILISETYGPRDIYSQGLPYLKCTYQDIFLTKADCVLRKILWFFSSFLFSFFFLREGKSP